MSRKANTAPALVIAAPVVDAQADASTPAPVVDAQADASTPAPVVDAQADASTLHGNMATLLASMSQVQLAAILAAMATGNTAPAHGNPRATLQAGQGRHGVGAYVIVATGKAKTGASGNLWQAYAHVGYTVAHAQAVCGMRNIDIPYDMLNVRAGGIAPALLGNNAKQGPMLLLAAPGTPPALAALDILAGASGAALQAANSTIAAYMPHLWLAQAGAGGFTPATAPVGKSGKFNHAPAPVMALPQVDAQADASTPAPAPAPAPVA
jgi:hypothetical protein